MAKLLISVEARKDLRTISSFIIDRSGSEDIAAHFVDALVARCARLADLPGTLGTARPDLRADLRSIPHKDYVIFFRYTDDAVQIINVMHGSRDIAAHFFDDSDHHD